MVVIVLTVRSSGSTSRTVAVVIISVILNETNKIAVVK